MSETLTLDVSDDLAAALRGLALTNGRTVEEVSLRLLRDAVARPDAVMSADEFLREAARVRATTQGRKQTPSEVLLREDRDR